MDENKKIILDFMSDERYVPMKPKEMGFILGVPKDKYDEFYQILKTLENECKIQISKKGKCSLVDSSIYKVGTLNLNTKRSGFVRVESSDEIAGVKGGEAVEEIYIAPNNMNNALNEDIVLVEIIDDGKYNSRNNNKNNSKYNNKNNSEDDDKGNGKDNKKNNSKDGNIDKNLHAEGRIVKILKHKRNSVVGTFHSNRNFAFVIPDDKRFGTDIFISKNNKGKAKNNEKVVVKILKYAQSGRNAEGKVTEILGRADEAGVDMLSLVREYNLPYEFPEPVLEEAKSLSLDISEETLKNRLDLRNKEMFTIDGEDAKDLDDAVYVEKKEDGNYILGVHIADVSHYVKENSKLDVEAIIRGTSIYMMDRVIPMLPKELSNGICSLNQGEDRLAISVIMEINKKGQVVSSDVRKSIIKVTKRMSYTNVFKILKYMEGLENTDEIAEYEQYFNHFKLMKELALILKSKREKDGSLDLDIPESKIILNEDGVAVDVKKYETTFANEIIEQFMLIANETIAEKFYWLEAPFIYRVHPAPDMDKIKELNSFIWNLGYRIKANQDNIHPRAFADVLNEVKGKPEERVVSNLILRTLKVAQYESENRGHFGIASKYYCHFTSPIRRYPDLFIHRIISRYIDKNYNLPEADLKKYSEEATKYARTSSEREKVAQKVERDSEDIKKAEYMSNKIGEEYDGIISNVTSFGVFVELDNTVEGLVRFEDLGDEYFIYDEERKQLIGEVTGKVYKIGGSMHIRVIEANKELRRISFENRD